MGRSRFFGGLGRPGARSSLLGGKKSPPSDEQGEALIQRWRDGDKSAFNDIFKTYRSLVYGVLHHLLPNDPEIDDVVQTAFIEVFRSLSSFEGRSKLSSWIARVALHVGYHHLRRRKSRPPDYEAERTIPELVDESPRGDPELAAERSEAIRAVYAVLETMAPKKRSVFILNDLEGMPQEEVAEVVGVGIATVRTRLFYARKEFWKKVEKDPALGRYLQTGDEEQEQDAKRRVRAALGKDPQSNEPE